MPKRLTPFLFNFREARDMILHKLAGAHGSPQRGLLTYDTNAERAALYNGTATKLLAYTDDVGEADGGDADTLGGQTLAQVRARSSHTGTQTASTISDFASAVVAALPSSLATDAEVTAAIEAVVGTSTPAALNTLDELAAALGDDANFASTVMTALGLRMRRYAQTFGNGTLTTFTITHNLNTRDVMVSMYDATTNEDYDLPEIVRNLNDIVLSGFTVAPANNSLRVVVMG